MRILPALALVFVLGATTAVAVSAKQHNSIQLIFQGVGEDKVGTTLANTSPNGKPDGHFTLIIDAPGETIVDIEIRSANPDGSPLGAGSDHWDTIRGGWWLIGVFRDGTLINPHDITLSEQLNGPTTYELYAESTGRFVAGNTFRVDVTFQSGHGIAAAIKIGSAGSFEVAPVAPSALLAPNALPGTIVPTTAPFTTTTTPVTPPAKLALRLSPAATSTRAGRCAALSVTLAGKPPPAAVVLLEQRSTASWRQVEARKAAGAKTRFSVCSKKAARSVYRVRLKARGPVLAVSNLASVTWK